ncbi:MAG: hypothetical protein QOJ35_1358 [Solirubrobacteraceae bacterium]|jgi:hypothetical protein|nr:hypothetical protein [Solirubrobacteraceae bacterium]
MAAVGRTALLEAHIDRARAVLRFVATAGVRERVEAIVVAEAECCASLTMCVSQEPGGVVLSVTAPEGGELVLGELADAFRGQTQAAG